MVIGRSRPPLEHRPNGTCSRFAAGGNPLLRHRGHGRWRSGRNSIGRTAKWSVDGRTRTPAGAHVYPALSRFPESVADGYVGDGLRVHERSAARRTEVEVMCIADDAAGSGAHFGAIQIQQLPAAARGFAVMKCRKRKRNLAPGRLRPGPGPRDQLICLIEVAPVGPWIPGSGMSGFRSNLLDACVLGSARHGPCRFPLRGGPYSHTPHRRLPLVYAPLRLISLSHDTRRCAPPTRRHLDRRCSMRPRRLRAMAVSSVRQGKRAACTLVAGGV